MESFAFDFRSKLNFGLLKLNEANIQQLGPDLNIRQFGASGYSIKTEVPATEMLNADVLRC